MHPSECKLIIVHVLARDWRQHIYLVVTKDVDWFARSLCPPSCLSSQFNFHAYRISIIRRPW